MRFLVVLMVLFSAPAMAAEALPVPPSIDDIPALKLFREQTQADVEFVARQYGIDMWVATKGDVVQVIYASPDGQGVLMNGVLFAPDGTPVTEQSMRDYAEGKISIIKDEVEKVKEAVEPKTPSAQLWADMSNTHKIQFGAKTAPILYTFVDPFCPHCKKFWEALSPYVQDGKINLNLIPVGILGDESARAATYMLNSGDSSQAWLDLNAGKLDAKVFMAEKDMTKITKNLNTMQKWKMQSTPFSVYRGTDGAIKMYRGNPDDIKTLLVELGVEK